MTILCLAPLVTFCWGGGKKKKMEMQIVDLTVLKASRGPLSSSRCFCRNQVRRRDSAAPGGSLQLPAVNFSCILCFRTDFASSGATIVFAHSVTCKCSRIVAEED